MEYFQKIEEKLAAAYAKAPALPKSGRTWLGNNVWWIVLIYAILGVFGIFSNIGALTAISTRNALESIYISADNNLLTVSAVFSLIVSIIVTVLYFLAVKPLKAKKKSGWNVILGTLILAEFFAVVSLVLSAAIFGNTIAVIAIVFGFIVGLLLVAVLLYFLFQIRGEFTGQRANAIKGEVVAKKSASTRKK